MIHAHNFLRWIVLILALVTVVKSLSGMNGKKAFTSGDRKTVLFYMISMDIQLLLGLALYVTGAWGIRNIQNQGMAAVMKDSVSRFFAVEHTIGMLIAIVLVHVANASVKKRIADNVKFKRVFILSLLSLIAILASIPWPFRELIGRPLFPGT